MDVDMHLGVGGDVKGSHINANRISSFNPYLTAGGNCDSNF